MVNKKLAIIGAGGHAKVVASTAIAAGIDVVGFYAHDPARIGTTIFGLPVKEIEKLGSDGCNNGIIAIGDNEARKKLSNDIDLNWISVVHPFAWVHPDVPIGNGTVICAGAIVQPGAEIGTHVIINTKASVDHDTSVGSYSHISVAHLAGSSSIDEGVLMALHSVVLPGIHVGAWAIVGAGAVVTKNVKPNTTVVGMPARAIKTNDKN